MKATVFSKRDVIRSLVIEAQGNVSKKEADRLVKKYSPFIKLIKGGHVSNR